MSHVSFLLSSFFGVPVSSTMGLLSLPLRWVFFASAPTVEASLSWAPAMLGLLGAEVVSARLNLSHSTIDVGSVCSSVLSHHNKDLSDGH